MHSGTQMTTETPTSILPSDAPLRYACICGYRAEYARLKSIDFLYYSHASDQFTVDCPDCETSRPTKVLDGNFTGETLVCVSTGEFIESPQKEPTGQAHYVDSTNADFTETPSPVEMAVGAFIIRCGNCDYLFDEDAKQEDGNAPSVGWSYYDCPQCNHKTRADIAEHTYDAP